MTAPTPVLVEHRGPVAVVTLNRPDHLKAPSADNALQHMTAEIRAQVLCSLTGDAGEGISAAVERRTPTFSNS